MRLLGFLLFLLIVVGVIGYFRGWIDFSHETLGGERKFGLSIDKEGFDEDLTRARSKVNELLEKVGDGEVDATVQSVDTRNRTMTVKTADGETLTLDLPADVQTKLDGAAAQLSSLRSGDSIKLEVDDSKIRRILGRRE